MIGFLAAGTPSYAEWGDPASVALVWNQHELSLDQPLLKKNGILFAPLRDLLSVLQADLTYSRRSDTYSLSLRGQKKSVTLNMGSDVFSDDGVLYVPLEQFAKKLNYHVDFRSDRVHIQTTPARDQAHLPIQLRVVQLHSGTYALRLDSPHKLWDCETKRLTSGTYQIDFPGTKATPFEWKPSSNPGLSVELTAVSPSISRLLVKTKPPYSLSGIIPTPYGADFHLQQSILGLYETTTSQNVILTLKLSGPSHYRLAEFTNPPRLVLDIPDTVLSLPTVLTHTQNAAPYKRIRASQFQLSPAQTRIVFDMIESSPVSIQRVPAGIQLVFPKRLPTQPTASHHIPASSPPKKVNPRVLALEGMLIVLDAGHGGDDPGAIGRDGTYEKEFTLDIAQRLKRLLTREGAHIMMTRDSDRSLGLENRSTLANVNHADLFISIHINSFFYPFTHGTETYYYKAQDEAFAKAVHHSIVSALKRPDKGLKKARLYVLRNTNMPAVLVEPFFITNTEDCLMLNQPYVRQQLAQAIFDGVVKFHRHNGG